MLPYGTWENIKAIPIPKWGHTLFQRNFVFKHGNFQYFLYSLYFLQVTGLRLKPAAHDKH
jgi:hypothetical protein